MAKAATKSTEEEEFDHEYDYEKQGFSRRITDFIAYHPYMTLALCLAVVLIFAGLFFGGAIYVGEAQNNGQILAIGEVEVLRWMTQLQHEDRDLDDDDSDVLPLSIAKSDFGLLALYSADGDNVFTPRGLKGIWRNERAMMGLDTRCDSCSLRIRNFEKYCAVNHDTLPDGIDACDLQNATYCTGPTTPLSMFFGRSTSFFDITEEMIDGFTQESIDDTLGAFTNFAGPQAFFLDAGFALRVNGTGGNLRSKYTRTSLSFGAPLCGTTSDGAQLYRNELDDEGAQNDEYLAFARQYSDFFEESDPAGITVNYVGEILSSNEIGDLFNFDFVLAGIAGVFILIGIVVQTRSLFLGLFGLLNIGFAYPISLFFYHGVFGFEFDTPLNRLAIFIILGIGADDIFIVTDAWKQSYHQGPAVMKHVGAQLNWTWKRAAKAMGITSFTTLFAFVMTAIAPVPMVQTFGLFAALMVFWNYMLVITWFPAAIVLWHKRFERQCCFRPTEAQDGLRHRGDSLELVKPVDARRDSLSSSSGEGDDDKRENVTANSNPNESEKSNDRASKSSSSSVNAADPESPAKSESADEKSSSFSEPKKDATSLPAAADTDGSETTATPRVSGEALMKSTAAEKNGGGIVGGEIADIENYRFLERYFYQKHAPFIYRFRLPIVIIFAILFVLGCVGTAFLETPTEGDSFLPAESELQKAINLLAEFPSSDDAAGSQPWVYFFYGIRPDEPLDRAGIDINDISNFGVIQPDAAFVDNFDVANQNHLLTICDRVQSSIASDGRGFVPRGTFTCVMEDYKSWELDTYGDEVDDISARMWQFVQLPPATSGTAAEQVGFDFSGDAPRISHIRLRFSQPLTFRDSFGAQEFWFEEWEGLMEDTNADSPVGLNNGFQTSESWATVATNRSTTSSTINSILISFVIAAIVLLFASRNLYVSALASLTIFGIVVSIIGLFTATGAKLDLVRSVIYIMIVGLSVDYVVHIATAFNDAPPVGRVGRARIAILEVGISVFGAALTTMGSAVFLFGAVLRFFQTFGNNLFVTILMSLLWSTTCFIALLMMFGPNQKESGDFGVLFSSCMRRVRGESTKNLSDSSADALGGKGTTAGRRLSSSSVSPEPTRDDHEIAVEDVEEEGQ